jgi:hypothetical protein
MLPCRKRAGRFFMPTPPDDILLNKATIIERCIRRIAE